MITYYVSGEKPDAAHYSGLDDITQVSPGGEWKHSYYCPHRNDPGTPYDDCAGCAIARPRWRVTTYTGAVLTTRERNYYDDSDFYAVVWDGEKITTVEYATTRFAGGGHATIDATEEVMTAAREWLADWVYDRWREENEAQSHRLEFGRMVKVVKGRKIPIGTKGYLMWIGQGQWGISARVDPGPPELAFFISASNLEVVSPSDHMEPDEAGQQVKQRVLDTEFKFIIWHLPSTYRSNMVVI